MLLACLLLNWIPLAVVFTIFFDAPNGLIIALVCVVLGGLFAISPLNEFIGRTSLGCRPATTEERKKILGAWQMIINSIGNTLDNKTKERFENVDLFVSDEKLPNAFALGRKTVCVTKGLLKLSSASEITGVLAHEAGHLHFGDSQRLAMALTANRLGVVSYKVLDVLSKVFEGFTHGVSGAGSVFGSSGVFVSLMGMILWLLAIIVQICLKAICFIFKIAVDVGIHAVGRSEEFRADLFAKNIGFGQPLAKFLRQIEALDSAPQNIWDVVYRTHPPTAERIDRLEQYPEVS
jgi:Zn-dependent protease with chaperone function